jgi:RimJ/RimL family protein N-acetyltransferase
MEQFPSPLSEAESAFVLEQIEAAFEQNGFGIWAVEARDTGAFIGLTGLSVVPFAAQFTPAVEVGWRLLPAAWGHGYATEAAAAAIWCGFREFDLQEIVSFTSSTNTRSIAVMERLEMTRDRGGDFEHPQIDPADPLCLHVLYRLGAGDPSSAVASAARSVTISLGSDRRR